MKAFPPTIFYRHQKENKKKCTLSPLVSSNLYVFLDYPKASLPTLTDYFILSIDGPVLSRNDSHLGLMLIDGTWKYAEKMLNQVLKEQTIPTRSLPTGFVTAYPRRQTLCTDPERGLASIEALYIANYILGRPTETLLDNYYWKNEFIDLNKKQLSFFI